MSDYRCEDGKIRGIQSIFDIIKKGGQILLTWYHDAPIEFQSRHKLYDEIEAIIASDNWISVKNRLPEIGLAVLIYTRDEDSTGYVVTKHSIASLHKHNGKYGDGSIEWIGDCGEINEKMVTHWMPLPEPPRDE